MIVVCTAADCIAVIGSFTNFLGFAEAHVTTRCSGHQKLYLTPVISTDELLDDDDYQDILEDMREECRKFGTLVKIIIPCPQLNDELSPGVGMLLLPAFESLLWDRKSTVIWSPRCHEVFLL